MMISSTIHIITLLSVVKNKKVGCISFGVFSLTCKVQDEQKHIVCLCETRFAEARRLTER